MAARRKYVVRKRRPKYGAKKRVYRRRRYGGALTDYLPSAETIGNAASYIPGSSYVKDKYNQGVQLYNTGKNIYHTGQKVVEVYNKLAPILNPPEPAKIMPPPLPRGGPPPLSARDRQHNKSVREGAPYARVHIPAESSGFLSTLKRIKPISFIDNALRAVGKRDQVRGYLQNKGYGSLVSGADFAIQQGYGAVPVNPYLNPNHWAARPTHMQIFGGLRSPYRHHMLGPFRSVAPSKHRPRAHRKPIKRVTIISKVGGRRRARTYIRRSL